MIEQSRALAARVHKDQKYAHLPYMSHVLDVYTEVSKNIVKVDWFNEGAKELNQCLALLHDAVEDASDRDVVLSNIYRISPTLHSCVSLITYNSGSRAERFMDWSMRVSQVMITEYPVGLQLVRQVTRVKLYDRYCNMAFSKQFDEAKYKMYKKEIKYFIALLNGLDDKEEVIHPVDQEILDCLSAM